MTHVALKQFFVAIQFGMLSFCISRLQQYLLLLCVLFRYILYYHQKEMHHSFLYEERFTRKKKVFVKNTDRMFLLIKKLQNVNSAFVSFHSHTHEHTQSVAVQFFFFPRQCFQHCEERETERERTVFCASVFFIIFFQDSILLIQPFVLRLLLNFSLKLNS